MEALVDRRTESEIERRCELASFVITGVALVAALPLHLLPTLLAGLLVYESVHALASRLGFLQMTRSRGKLLAVTLLAVAIVGSLVAAGWGTAAFFRSEVGSIAMLLNRLADIVDRVRDTLPLWVDALLPPDTEDYKALAVDLLKENARGLQHAGREVTEAAVRVLVGMVIGALVALHETRGTRELGPLARSLLVRADRLGDSFRSIVFAQIRISALNTTLTAIFLVIVLPLFGAELPMQEVMIGVTFVAGLLPVVGNLISNTVITLVALSQSFWTAVICLGYLVVIHKLEYFVNARLVGSQIHAKAWEILIAMLVLETAFGVAGVVAAPIYYAYVKNELEARGLI